ncbi:hypothetical protein [Deinococcus planocerae]|uniref:hypothetical protein n=1 Tax=Deinococcus planocerae TaxID=1737569 RepID=UPI000C7ED3C1|nr:hypothetical protein [Deinococcus planocerae]
MATGGGFEDLTSGEVERQADMERHWDERLDEGQRATAERLQATGLTGTLQIGDGFKFRWLRGDDVLAESDFHPRFPEAFEEAVARLPASEQA